MKKSEVPRLKNVAVGVGTVVCATTRPSGTMFYAYTMFHVGGEQIVWTIPNRFTEREAIHDRGILRKAVAAFLRTLRENAE